MAWKQIIEDNPDNGNDDIWRYQDGGSLEGEYIKKDTEVGQYDSNVYHIKTKDGVKKVFGSTVLDGRMDKVAIGTTVKIESLGKPTGKNYYNFNVFEDDGE